MKTTVYIVSHKNIYFPYKKGYQPIQVGNSEKNFDNYVRDNVGYNISKKNANYCELTAQYWIWKNDTSDIKGLVHYRRFFEDNNINLSLKMKKNHIINEKQINSILTNNDMILPKKRNYFIETMYSHYIHSHKKEGLEVTREVIKEKFPNYLISYDRVMNRKKAHMFNMMVSKKNIFNNYSKWLFEVLSEVEKRLDISNWNKSESRVYGYISELLLDVWLDQHKSIRYKELSVGFIGNQHWIKKIIKFLIGKFYYKGSKNE